MKSLISTNTVVVGIAFLVLNSSVLAQSNKKIEQTGDVLQFAIPLAAYGMTYLFDDHQGRRSFAVHHRRKRRVWQTG